MTSRGLEVENQTLREELKSTKETLNATCDQFDIAETNYREQIDSLRKALDECQGGALVLRHFETARLNYELAMRYREALKVVAFAAMIPEAIDFEVDALDHESRLYKWIVAVNQIADEQWESLDKEDKAK